MKSARKTRWQQATAVASLSTCGAMTGFTFSHGTVADLTSPTSMPVHLLAFNKPVQAVATSDSVLRSAIVKAAVHYLRLARNTTPADMQALIWQGDSIGGADHGESCAAFASLVLEMGAHATGEQSWVSGGGTYPYPLHRWADVRVQPNPDSPGVVSIQQDAQAHGRWHPIDDGYTPEPGDWVLFDGHVEVVTNYAGGLLYTIGGDSMPNFSVNAHQYREPLDAQGVLGFVDNGELVTTASETVPSVDAAGVSLGRPAIPGLLAPGLSPTGGGQQADPPAQQQESAGTSAAGGAIIPGLEAPTSAVATGASGQSSQAYGRHQAPAVQVPSTAEQQAFISEVAPGAIAAQLRYGIPASVTIAQAIDESGWGQSELATQDHNLFGIKGTGPAGAVDRPTEEYQGGRWVATTASFRVYHNMAQSIADHSTLLATGGSYQQAMADRQVPDAFANDLTGVYATDPSYGSSLISIMRLYNLYRYDTSTATNPAVTVTPPPVVTQVAAADHGADLPGLEPTALAFGGSSQLGASTDGSVHGVPRPRGATLSGGVENSRATGMNAHRVRTDDGVGRGGEAPGNLVRGDRSRGGERSGASTRGGGTRGGTTQGGFGAGSRGRTTQGGLGAGTREGTTQGGRGSGTRGGTTQGGRGSGSGGGTTRGGLGADARGETTQGRSSIGAGAQDGVAPGGARIPGLVEEYPSVLTASSSAAAGAARLGLVGGGSLALAGTYAARSRRERGASAARANARVGGRPRAKRYVPQIPSVVTTDFMTMAKPSIARAKPLYQDVAREHGIRWELLAACDWMQCKADPRYSPVQGEKLGTRNDDGTVFRTKPEALAQTAADLIALADAVYHIDLTAGVFLSVADLARVFAAFRWGGLLRAHHVSAMKFPYSVEGLTAQYMDMHWPDIREPNAPDKPGGRFRLPFGAVPVILTLDYPAVA